MATASPALRHVGAGLAVRASHHARRQAERVELEAPLEGGVLRELPPAIATTVQVPAAALVDEVSTDAAALGYAMPGKRAGKKQRRAAAEARAVANAAEGGEGGAADAVTAQSRRQRDTARQAAVHALQLARDADAAAPAPAQYAPAAVGEELGPQLMDVRRKLREYLSQLAERGESVEMVESRGERYPCWQFAGAFGRWLALKPRQRRSKASMWEDDGAERMTRGGALRSWPGLA